MCTYLRGLLWFTHVTMYLMRPDNHPRSLMAQRSLGHGRGYSGLGCGQAPTALHSGGMDSRPLRVPDEPRQYGGVLSQPGLETNEATDDGGSDEKATDWADPLRRDLPDRPRGPD